MKQSTVKNHDTGIDPEPDDAENGEDGSDSDMDLDDNIGAYVVNALPEMTRRTSPTK